MKTAPLSGLTVILLVGCASVSEPLRIGPDSYQLNSISKSGLASWGDVKDMAINKANLHCESQGKAMILSDEQTSGVKIWTPMEAHIKYKCVTDTVKSKE